MRLTVRSARRYLRLTLPAVAVLLPVLGAIPVSADSLPLLAEGFETAVPVSWAQQNLSEPQGGGIWIRGNPNIPGSGFSSQEGPLDSFIVCNFTSTTGAGTISNWLFTPVLPIHENDELRFFTRTSPGSAYPDRMEVRLSVQGASTNVGLTSASVGDFDVLLQSINPNLVLGGYPNATWTEYRLKVPAVPDESTGRYAFRYFVADGGPSGANSNIVGIDSLSIWPSLIFADGFESTDTSAWDLTVPDP